MRRILQFTTDVSGNFAVMTALLMPLLLSVSLIAVEFANTSIKQSQAQKASDTMALQAAGALNENQSLASVEAASGAGFAALMGLSPDMVNVTIKPGRLGADTVEFVTDYSVTSLIPFGPESATLQTGTVIRNTQVNAGKAATLSMYLILDRSGSMKESTEQIDVTKRGCVVRKKPTTTNYSGACYMTKMEVMKRSLKTFFDRIQSAPPGTLYARTGAISFHLSADENIPITDMNDRTAAYIEALRPSGGTNSAPPFLIAEKAFEKEDAAHAAKTGSDAYKYLVFVTDGYNASYVVNNKKTLASCDKIKAQGVKIFTIFLKYRALSDRAVRIAEEMVRACASSPENYYRTSDATEFGAAINTIGSIAVSKKTKLIR